MALPRVPLDTIFHGPMTPVVRAFHARAEARRRKLHAERNIRKDLLWLSYLDLKLKEGKKPPIGWAKAQAEKIGVSRKQVCIYCKELGIKVQPGRPW
jgi:hypothetical protein